MKKSLITLAITAAAAISGQAVAGNFDLSNAGHWIVRGGLSHIETNSSRSSTEVNTIPGLITVDMYNQKLKNTTSPRFSLTYMSSPHIGFELATTLPTKMNLEDTNSTDKSKTNYQQISFAAQYYFMDSSSRWQPYTGLGIEYNDFSKTKTKNVNGLNTSAKLKNSFGPMAEIGLDYYINQNWLVNASASYSLQKTKYTAVAETVHTSDKINYNPLAINLSIGYRF